MSSYPKHYYTLEEYFALELVGDARYEYWDGDIVCMSGGSQAHSLITSNIHGLLFVQTRNSICRALTGESPIKTPTLPPYRYPDASVVCGKAEFENIGGIDVLVNPVVIVEVLSPQTEKVDKGAKFEAYKAIGSVKEYLLISQDEPHLTHYIKEEDGRWKRFDTAESFIKLEAINSNLYLKDIYDGVEFK